MPPTTPSAVADSTVRFATGRSTGFARPDGSCLGRQPEEDDQDEGRNEPPVPAAPADPREPPADPATPMNPA
ncbi:hypothetical protein [Azospirillum sp. sgz302134]